MLPKVRFGAALAALGVFLGVAALATSDEGMWLYNNPPTKQLKEKHNFEPTKEWLEHLQKSSVRFNTGGSGSFVSANGLVMTNHHVGADQVAKLGSEQKNYLRDGFHAKSQAEELKCPDLELNVLWNIEDVTDKVNAAVQVGMSPEQAQKARRAVINTIEKEASDATKMRCDVVTLYQGGAYHLYKYKKYTDVRLVFAPEQDMAFFGGDPDNFEYPRFDLDITFFRVYENDKPLQPEHYLAWSPNGAAENELVFVSGHPGKTDRQNTIAHLEFARDLDMPFRLDLIRRRELLLSVFSERGLENARRARDELFTYQNSRKARLGMLAGLQDPKLMQQKMNEEKELRDFVQGNSNMKENADAFDMVNNALTEYRKIYVQHYLLERGIAFNSDYFTLARHLVRAAAERPKPNAERLRDYAESGLESLKQHLFSEAPIYDDMETVKLADSLSLFMEKAGNNDEWVRKTLNGSSPRDKAEMMIRNTKLKDITYRKKLYDEGQQAIDASDDPFIRLAVIIDPPSRELRKIYETKVDEPMKQAYAKLAKARFAKYGQGIYPDATFTLRLTFGQIKGYEENGQKVPAFTTLGGTYTHSEKHGGKEPFKLTQRWLDRKGKINLDTPYNFVSTCDIIGGNSGSPTVNAKGEVVGIIFDGNIQSLVLDYAFTDVQARAVSVDSRAIIECLRNVYDAGDLADELMAKKK
jgi:hypothetical protein